MKYDLCVMGIRIKNPEFNKWLEDKGYKAWEVGDLATYKEGAPYSVITINEEDVSEALTLLKQLIPNVNISRDLRI